MGSFTPWGKPDPQSVAGLNSAMVYGENIQVAVGLNHQIALGSNLQLCINPLALFDLLSIPESSTLSGMFGGGLGGNLQMTIGTNTNITWGRQFQISMGPESINVDANDHKPFTIVMCALIGAASIVYAIAYGLETDEDKRATIVILFQILMDVLLAAFVIQEMTWYKVDEHTTDTLKHLFNAPVADHGSLGNTLAQALEFVVILSAIITPPIVIATEEGHFQGDPQSSN